MSITSTVVQAAAPTSTGTQDITVAGFGTPKAALVYMTYGLVAGTQVDHAALSAGVTDGTTAIVAQGRVQDNVGTSDSRRRGRTGALVQLFNTIDTTLVAEAGFDSFIADGIRLNWTTAPGSAYVLTVVLFGGTGLVAHVDDILVTSTTGQSITGPGFTPRMVFGIGHGTSFNDSNGTDYPPQLGVATRGDLDAITQGSANATFRHNSSANEAGHHTSDANLVINLNPGDDNPNRSVRLTGWLADGFQVQKITGTHSFDLWFAYLALGFPDEIGVWSGIITTPTTPGTQADTRPGFQPQILGLMGTQVAALNQTGQNGSPAVLGTGFATASQQGSVAIMVEDLPATSNTKSLTTATALTLPDNQGTERHVAVLSSFDASGFTLDFQATHTAEGYWVAWAIEAVDTGGTPVGAQRGGIWDVQAGVAGSRTATWDTRVAIGDTAQALWDANVAVGDAAVAVWTANQLVADSAVAVWDTRDSTGQDSVALWNASSAVASERIGTWSLRASIGGEAVALWSTAEAIGRAATADWTIRDAISTEHVALWDAAQAVAESTAAVWSVAGSIGVDAVALYDVSSALGTERDALWDVQSTAALQPVGASTIAVWDVWRAIGQNRIGQYDAREMIARSVATIWSQRAIAMTDAVALWSLRNSVASVATGVWAVRMVVTDERDALWSVSSLTGDASVALWDVQTTEPVQPVGADVGSLWAVQSIVASEPVAVWHVSSIMMIENVGVWSLNDVQGMESAALWSQAALAGEAGSALWTVHAAVDTEADAQWGVLIVVADDGAAAWSLRAVVGDDVLSQWDIAGAIVIERVARWDTQSLFHPATTVIGVRVNVRGKARGRFIMGSVHSGRMT